MLDGGRKNANLSVHSGWNWRFSLSSFLFGANFEHAIIAPVGKRVAAAERVTTISSLSVYRYHGGNPQPRVEIAVRDFKIRADSAIEKKKK